MHKPLPNRFPIVALDQFIVMPNHIHGIVQITVEATLAVARESNPTTRNDNNCDDFGVADINDRAPARGAPTMGHIIGAYKSLCVHHCLQWMKSNNPAFFMGILWQRNLYERTTNALNSFMVCCGHADDRSRRPMAVIGNILSGTKMN